MSTVIPTFSELVVRDSQDDEDLTDIEDEVFIRDGKNGSLKFDDDGDVKRPLMAPRRKYRKSHNFETYRFSNRAVCVPLCYGFLALIVLLALIILCIYVVNVIPISMSILKKWLSKDFQTIPLDSNVVPCTSLSTKVLWTRSLPKLTSESPLRSNDVNGDGVEDIIIGFGTGLDMKNIPEYVCTLYFEGQVPCFGGVLALNGKTGDTLWAHWTAHAIFSIDCELDLTNDKVKDCIICGQGGILQAINGHDGTGIWEIPIRDSSISEEWKLSDIYDAKFIADIDGDEIGDIIASHTIQSREIHLSEVLLISGNNGNIIHSTVLPSTEQLLLAPQRLVHPDGESIFVLVTSSHKQTGGLYIIPQVNLMYGDLKLRKLHHDTGRSTLLPPILVDVTLDGIEDIVAAMFNSTIIVYDGLTFEQIWNCTIPNSEVISVPIPGYFNDDNIPDFMVKHQIGLGYPTYYYTVATIIDGKTGKSLLEKPIEDSLSKKMSGLSVTVEGFGNDWFLHWSVDCLNYEGIKEKYQFLKNKDSVSESRADLCKLRFNSTLITNLYALSQHVGPPGMSLYFSENWKFLEYNISLKAEIEHDNVNAPYISERSEKIHTSPNEGNAFEQEHKMRFDTMDSAISETYNQLIPVDVRNNIFQSDSIPKNQNEFTQNNIKKNEDYEMTFERNNEFNVHKDSTDNQQMEEMRKRRNTINQRFTNNVDKEANNFVEMVNIKNKTNLAPDGTNFENNYTKTVIFNEKAEKLQYNADKVNINLAKQILNTVQTSTRDFYPTVSNPDKITVNDNNLKKGQYQVKNEGIIENPAAEFKIQRKKRDTKHRRKPINLIHGVQKQSPTGILLPSILESQGTTAVDLIFSTFWLPSSDAPIVLVQEDFDCIHWKKVLSEKNLQYKENDDIVKECLNERGVNYEADEESTDTKNFQIPFGQMTIYRMRLECTCPEDMLPNQKCKNISLNQSWPEYLGSQGNGYFKSFYKINP